MCNENCGSDGDEIAWEREDDEIVKKVAVSRLFCLNRIEMEKNGFLYFSSSKTNNPSGQYFTVCPKSLYLKALQDKYCQIFFLLAALFLKEYLIRFDLNG